MPEQAARQVVHINTQAGIGTKDVWQVLNALFGRKSIIFQWNK